MRHLILTLLFAISATLICSAEPAAADSLSGKKVESEQEVTKLFPGYSLHGVIGDRSDSKWPATIHSIQAFKDGAIFEVKGYGRHEYPRKDNTGKSFQIIILDTPNGKQTAIILIR